MTIDYDPTINKYLLDARITTKAKVRAAARAQGLTFQEAEMLLRAVKLCATFNRYLEEPEPITYEQSRQLLFNMLANALDRQLSLRKAERWVRATLRPGKKRVSCYCLKHTLDHWYQRHGSACYLREADFIDVLRRCGHVVRNGYVRIEEVPA
jgi:hypothetical protein